MFPLIRDPALGRVIYTPPDGAALGRLLANLGRFLAERADGMDPLIKMAVMHYQFEAIHPFSDGNGRTGRILNVLYLKTRGLLDAPIIYVSRYFMTHRSSITVCCARSRNKAIGKRGCATSSRP